MPRPTPPTTGPRARTPGWLVPIGGALADPAIFERFITLAGGPGARIVVIPVASRLPRTGLEYADALRQHGARETPVLDVRTRADSEHPGALAALETADGVFFTGGDQVRLAEVLGGTPVARVLRRRWAEDGLPVAGTSAGASYLSERMIARGWAGARPRAGMVTLITGLGLAGDLIVDQHFRERRREGRLMAAVAIEPRRVGVGVDEDTAAFIAPDGRAEVVGAGGLTVVDAGEARPLDAAAALALSAGERRRATRPGRPGGRQLVEFDSLRVRVVESGGRVDLAALVPPRAAAPPPAPSPA